MSGFKSNIFGTLVWSLRPTLDKGPGFNFIGTHLDWFEVNWILELDYQLIFAPKQVPWRFSLNLSLFFGLGPSSSKWLGTNLTLSINKIAWIHWSLDLEPLSKVALRGLTQKGQGTNMGASSCWDIYLTVVY
jgi:hypothetical protein